jgi:hypothetical protein
LHSFYVSDLKALHARAKAAGLRPSAIIANEFAEPSFRFTGPDEVHWQILQIKSPSYLPKTELKLEKTERITALVPSSDVVSEK